jgi:hypothetical protein
VATLQISGCKIGCSDISVMIDEVPITSDPTPGRDAPEPSIATG